MALLRQTATQPVARVPPALARQGDNPAGLASSAGPEGADRPADGASAHALDVSKFAIGFDERDRPRLHELWDGVIDSGRWTEGPLTEAFESAWSQHNELPAAAFGGSRWVRGRRRCVFRGRRRRLAPGHDGPGPG